MRLLALLHQLRSPARGLLEEIVNGITALEIGAHLREPFDEEVQRLTKSVGVRQADIAPDI